MVKKNNSVYPDPNKIEFKDIKIGDIVQQTVFYPNGDQMIKAGTVIEILGTRAVTRSFSIYDYKIPKETGNPRLPQYVTYRCNSGTWIDREKRD